MTVPTATAAGGTAPTADLSRISILIVDDEPGMRNFLRRALEKDCALLATAASAAQAEALRQRFHFDLLLVDIRLPGDTGIEWISELRARGGRSDVIFISAFADLGVAIEALRLAATDLLLKPFGIDDLQAALHRWLQRRAAPARPRQRPQVDDPLADILGVSPAMAHLRELVVRVAATPATVLIEGETGTGKELIARAIHRLSNRAGGFVAVNCGSISPQLLESELFGHVKGAFTDAQRSRDGLFVAAGGGTLFLDEISELPLELQPKLLRAIEERSVRPVGSDREIDVNMRLIAATNRELSDATSQGEFRRDLFFRLNVVRLQVPTLRERHDDLALLAEHFNRALSGELGVVPLRLDGPAVERLCGYHWPGNVRELRNFMERSLLMGELQFDGALSDEQAALSATGYPPDWSLAQVEKNHTLAALDRCGGNKSATARQLGISRKTLERKLHGWRAD